MRKSPPPRKTPHHPTVTLNADEFRMGPRYDNWRPGGTPDWLLIVTIGGGGQVGDGRSSLLSETGTVTLYQPGTSQRYYTDPGTKNWRLLWSHFHPRPHWSVWLGWPEHTRGLRTIQLNDPVVFQNVKQAMADVVRFCRHQLPGSTDLALNALERALLWIHSVNDRETLDERIRHALDLLAEKLQEPLPLDKLARDCGLSVSRLAHLFREQVGMPPQQYLEELRLQRAAQLLRTTGLRIGEIAAGAGYADAFYFSSRFRKKFGRSPSEYRR